MFCFRPNQTMEKLNNRNVLIVENCNDSFTVRWWHITVKWLRWSICLELLDAMMNCLLLKLLFVFAVCASDIPANGPHSQLSEIHLMSIFCYFSFCEIASQRSLFGFEFNIWTKQMMCCFFESFLLLFLLRQFVDEQESSKQRNELYEAHGWFVQRMKCKIGSYKAFDEYFKFYGIYQWQFSLEFDSFPLQQHQLDWWARSTRFKFRVECNDRACSINCGRSEGSVNIVAAMVVLTFARYMCPSYMPYINQHVHNSHARTQKTTTPLQPAT